MVPLFAGVIIAGLGIGALLSAFAARRMPTPLPSHSPVVVLHTPTSVARTATPESVARATQTPIATAKPAATTTASPTPEPTRAQTETPSSAPTARATNKPLETAKPAPTIKPTPKPAVAAATAAPTAVATPRRVAEIPQTPRVDRQGFFAQTLVRRFLNAVANGDDPTAYAALGGGGAGTLSEAQFLDPTLRITSMSSSHNSDGGTDVQVEMRTAKGEYFGTFAVDSSGTRITQREIIPVAGTTAR